MQEIIDIKELSSNKCVIHFLSLITKEDEKQALDTLLGGTSILYAIALKKAKPHGGYKYHNKSYGGGIAFDFPVELVYDRVKTILREVK
jgi:hypothetical protein